MAKSSEKNRKQEEASSPASSVSDEADAATTSNPRSLLRYAENPGDVNEMEAAREEFAQENPDRAAQKYRENQHDSGSSKKSESRLSGSAQREPDGLGQQGLLSHTGTGSAEQEEDSSSHSRGNARPGDADRPGFSHTTSSSPMDRENAITDASDQVLEAAKPAIAVASGSIVAGKLTNFVANSFLADQPNWIYEGARVALPIFTGTTVFASSKNDLVRSHAIGHVLSGVENLLDWLIPSLSDQGTTQQAQQGRVQAMRRKQARRQMAQRRQQSGAQRQLSGTHQASSDQALGMEDHTQNPAVL